MNQKEKIVSAFQQDITLPAIVTQKADEAFAEILAKEPKETGKMKNRPSKLQKKKTPIWIKAAAAAAAAVLLAAGFCTANPVLAAKLPLIGHLFAMLQESSEYPGDYQEYANPLEETVQTPKQETQNPSPSYTQTAGGVTVTLSEIYCNQTSLSIAMLVESKEPFADKILKPQNGSVSLSLEAASNFSFRPLPYIGDKDLTGTFMDEKTFAGIWRIDLSGVLTDESEVAKIVSQAEANGEPIPVTDDEIQQYIRTLTLPEQFTMEIDIQKIVGDLANPEPIDWGVSDEELESMSDEQFQKLYQEVMAKTGREQYPNQAEHYWFEGPWKFSVPVSVNLSGASNITVEETGDAGVGLHAVSVTPFELCIDPIDPDFSCVPVVFDAQGQWMEYGGDLNTLPIAGHDISHITVYLCSETEWLNEIKGHREEENFMQYVAQRALYQKELLLPTE